MPLQDGSIALPISFECALLHHSAHPPIPAQLRALIGVSIGLRNNVIPDAAQLDQPFAALLQICVPDEV